MQKVKYIFIAGLVWKDSHRVEELVVNWTGEIE